MLETSKSVRLWNKICRSGEVRKTLVGESRQVLSQVDTMKSRRGNQNWTCSSTCHDPHVRCFDGIVRLSGRTTEMS